MRSLRLAPAAILLLAPILLIPAAPAQAVTAVSGDVVDSSDATITGVTVRVDGAAAATTGPNGAYSLTLSPGRHTLEYAKTGYASATYDGELVVDAEGDVTVELDGESEAVEDGRLDTVTLLAPAPAMVTAPALVGTVAPGQTVEATVGTWSPDIKDGAADEDWRDYVTVEWFLDGEPADDHSAGYYSQKLVIPAAAGGRQLSFRLTVEDDADIWAPIVHTSAAVAVPRAQASVKASYVAGRIKVVVTVPGTDKPVGQVTVLEGTKKVGKAKLSTRSKGKATVKVRLKRGKHKLVVTFDGGKSVLAATAKVKVKVA